MLHIIYRSCGGENRKGRPIFYSKLSALVSLLQSLAELKRPHEIIYLNDGPLPQDRARVMAGSGEIVAREGLGAAGSMRAALDIATSRGWAETDLVWFAEDDHLYSPAAFAGLMSAASAFPRADYFGLYATIGRCGPDGTSTPDWAHFPSAWKDSNPVLVNGRRWRRALSTTSTFGARVAAIGEDRPMMTLAMRSGGAWDHTTCLMYQGFAPSSWRALANHYGTSGVGPRARLQSVLVRGGLNIWQLVRQLSGAQARLLVAPEPALSTHLESEHLAIGTDWAGVARACAAWGAAHGLLQPETQSPQPEPQARSPMPAFPSQAGSADPLRGMGAAIQGAHPSPA